MSPTGPDRRTVLLVGVTGATSVAALAACGSQQPTTSGAPGAPPASAAPSGAPSSTGPAAPIVAVAAVPVGGAVSATSATGAPLIVARPTTGTVVAFSAICTHQGCTVAPAGKQLDCPCHGSVYDAMTGANVSGPAPRPLAKVAVTVVDGQVLPG